MTLTQENFQPSPPSRIAIITGAGSGIGRASALALLADGWRVTLSGRRREPLQAVAREAGTASDPGAPDRAFVCPADVTDPDSVRALFEQTVAHFGRVDLLFNNAGTGNPPGPFEDWTPQQWRAVVDVNLNGMFYCLQQAFRTMKAQHPRGGRIINNGSIAATSPRPNSAAYTATKHAVQGLTRAAALDGRAWDIAVGQIDVGNAMTELVARMGQTQGVLQANGQIVAEPVMDVAIVGQSVLYMANLPLEANVLFHTVMATKMPFVGRG
ncbi:MAG: SDR family oxidoreductase [Burkholderiaceae bacterium]|nr:SDR family oxidoreductase [Burkholderiaceae bacterium]